MSDYKRLYVKGGCYFFTVVTWQRQKLFASSEAVSLLRQACKIVMLRKPFVLEAMVLLPDHLHCIMRLPVDDHDYSGRWREIKKYVSRRIRDTDTNSRARVWQSRFWEHLIRDDNDWRRHMDYIHYNPVKHGYVSVPLDWPHSSLRKYVDVGMYPADWGAAVSDDLRKMHIE
ncbi:MAG: transposase [Wenzhouxiangellaceae bacterium]